MFLISGCLTIEGIFITLVVHCAALMKILRCLIEQTTDEDIPKALRVKYLLACIWLYQKIFKYCLTLNKNNQIKTLYYFRFSSKIDALYRYHNLLQCCTSNLILCLVFFQGNMSMDPLITLRAVVYLSAGGFQILLYCYNSQKIIDESDLLPAAWYNCQWYLESPEFRKHIKMMIQRSNRGFSMHMGDFSNISLVTFKVVNIINYICSLAWVESPSIF